MLKTDYGLADAFLRVARDHPARPALVVRDAVVSYRDLAQLASDWAATIDAVAAPGDHLVAVLGERTVPAYTGILAALVSGRGYLPLNPRFPAERLQQIMVRSGVALLIASDDALEALEGLLQILEQDLTILLTSAASAASWRERFPTHRFIDADSFMRKSAVPARVQVNPNDIAYLLFTSGSTGEPKGVAVSHANVAAYTHYVTERYEISELDRFSQLPDVTFDLSIQDLWPCWTRGACLCSVPKKSVFSPAAFVRDQKITIWTSVPSVVSFMDQLHLLKECAFPTIRWSIFCGEALSLKQVRAWSKAACNSKIENLYGPTEVTVASTGYIWNPETSPAECLNDIVPIGWSFDHQQARIVDDHGNEVAPGQQGELCLGGPQVTGGYLNDPQKTADRFVKLPNSELTWYRTGDLATRDARGCMYFVGRMDNQVKIRGYRVELQEIDFAVRQAAGVDTVVSIAWPIRNGTADGVVAFIAGETAATEASIIEHCRSLLPDYMVPRKLFFIPSLPVTANGKVNRTLLNEMLKETS